MDVELLGGRFHTKYEIVTESGCWLWTGALNWYGYGLLDYKGKQVRAHRLSYAMYHNDFDESLHILHNCDITCCVNPNHLRQGTHADNMRDIKDRKRGGQRGEKSHFTKLTVEDIVNIRKMVEDSSCRQRDLADLYEIDQSSISRIINNKVWNI